MQCSEFSYNGLTAANRVRSPNGLYATIQTKVVTRKLKGKNEGFSVGDDIYNTEIPICTCMYCIFWVLVKFNLKIYFSMTYHQFLCPVTGEGGFSKNKAAWKNKLEI